MRILQRYIGGEILRAVALVLAALLVMVSFIDLTGELKAIARGGYELQHAFLYILLRLPGNIYELMPLAALIGTIWTMAQLASRSEFTIMRASSLSTLRAVRMLARIGLPFVAFTFVMGEFVAPYTSELAQGIKLRAQGRAISQEFRSGQWTKDQVKDPASGQVIGSRFLNVREVLGNGELRGLKVYEFDTALRLKTLVTADSARYRGDHVWELANVTETHFPQISLDREPRGEELRAAVGIRNMARGELVSEITPDIMTIAVSDPDRMSAYDLKAYSRHLAENRQQTERYEIAFWKKLIYPFAVLVMMALALPFAYLHVRSGGVSLKIFSGIMIGVSFYLLNSLFSHIGLLNTWPAFVTSVLPSLLFLLMATAAIWWVEKH